MGWERGDYYMSEILIEEMSFKTFFYIFVIYMCKKIIYMDQLYNKKFLKIVIIFKNYILIIF